MAERALILGGCGFIGSHLARLHLSHGDEVHVTTRLNSQRRSTGALDGVALSEVDLSDAEQVEDVFAAAKPTIVYHLATGTPHSSDGLHDPFHDGWLSNVQNLVRIVDVARRYRPTIKAFVRSGTLAEYGQASSPSREDEREEPVSLHGMSSLAATQYLRFVAPELPFPAMSARLGLTYGMGQDESFLVPALLRNLLSGRGFHVREPNDRRDMIHVDDVARGLMMLASRPIAPGDSINICSGVALTTRRIAEIICAAAGRSPELLSFGTGHHMPSIVWGSIANARERIGFTARTEFSKGIEGVIREMTARSG